MGLSSDLSSEYCNVELTQEPAATGSKRSVTLCLFPQMKTQGRQLCFQGSKTEAKELNEEEFQDTLKIVDRIILYPKERGNDQGVHRYNGYEDVSLMCLGILHLFFTDIREVCALRRPQETKTRGS